MCCNRKFVSVSSLNFSRPQTVVDRLAALTFFVRALPLLPAVLLLTLCHEGSGGHDDVCVRVPRRLATEEGGVIPWEAPAHMGLGLYAVEVHDWEEKRSACEKVWTE